MLTKKMIPALVALITALLLMLLTIILPKQDYSEKQNKSLSYFPKFTLNTFTNQNFSASFEQYMSDHFVGRENCISINNSMRLAVGNDEINHVFVRDDRLIEDIGYYDVVTAEKNISAIRQFVNASIKPPDCYASLIPTASEIYKEKLPTNSAWLSQSEFIRHAYEELMSGSSVIDMQSALESQKSGNIFYLTDSRWTSYGAFVGYEAIIKALGMTPALKDMFSIEHTDHDYYGDLYNKTLIKTKPADVIDLYSYLDGNVISSVEKTGGEQRTKEASIYDKDYLQSSQKLKVFLGYSAPVTTVNTTIDNGQSLLIFKDSFSDPLVQFLSLHFDKITLIDLKYLTEEAAKAIHINDYSSVLFLYGVGNFVSDNSIAAKLSFVQ